MPIKPEDLDAVRSVLDARRTSLEEVAKTYDLPRSALVAATILLAVQWQSERKGEFGESLVRLVIKPGIPEGGWPRDDDNYPSRDPWFAEKSQFRLVATSRRLGLHKAHAPQGNDIRLIQVPELLGLLAEDDAYAVRARELYQRHVLGIDPQRIAKQAERLRAAIAAHPQLEHIRDGLLLYPAEELAEVRKVLGELLAQYPLW